MKEKYNTDDSFLGRWIEGKLSPEELEAFKKSDVYKQYKAINDESQKLSGPDIDVDSAFNKVRNTLNPGKKEAKVVNLKLAIGIAALLIILLGIFSFYDKTYENGIGKTQTIVLSDGSEVILNVNSSLSHRRFFWSLDKTVELKGEAYFKIEKGDGFSVSTSKGIVNVLGTKFNLKNWDDLELSCFEGRVEYKPNAPNSKSKILTKGMKIIDRTDRITESVFSNNSPSWLDGRSDFENKPLYMVLEELSNYYNIEFNVDGIDTNRLYNGSFVHNDLELALKSTLSAMNIKYTKQDDVYILSSK